MHKVYLNDELWKCECVQTATPRPPLVCLWRTATRKAYRSKCRYLSEFLTAYVADIACQWRTTYFARDTGSLPKRVLEVGKMQELSPPDFVWPKVTNATFGHEKWDRSWWLTGGWGDIGIFQDGNMRIEFHSETNVNGVVFISNAFRRLKASLGAFADGSVPYTRMHYAPLQHPTSSMPSPQLAMMDTLFSIDKIGDSGKTTTFHLGMDEAYSMRIFRKQNTGLIVNIQAQTAVGVARALTSFQQLCEWSGKFYVLGGLPIHITDRPRFQWRGLMVDTSRHFIPLAQLEKVLVGMSHLKLNSFHWHIVDSQSFPFQSTSKPLLSAKGAYSSNAVYRTHDVKHIVDFAASLGVRVVPEFDVPAHTASWGEGYPDMIVPCPKVVVADDRLIEHGVDKVALNPLHEGTYTFLKTFFDEVFDLFPDQYIHFGGDEVNADCWLTSPDVQKWKTAYEKTPNAAAMPWHRKLQEIFTNRVMAMAKAKGKVAVLWDEALDLTGLTENHIIQWWRGWLPGQPNIAHSKHLKTVISPGFYLDDLSQSWQKMYAQNIPSDNTGMTLGGEACSWEEHADEANLEHRIFSRLPSVAERLWSPAEKTERGVQPVDKPRIGRTLCRLRQHEEIRVGPVFPDYCPVPLRSPSTGSATNVVSDGDLAAGGGMTSEGIAWRAFGLFAVAMWLATIYFLYRRKLEGKTARKTDAYEDVSYSPVSTDEEVEDPKNATADV